MGATSLLPLGGLQAFELIGSEWAEMRLLPATGQPFCEILRLQTYERFQDLENKPPWRARVRVFPSVPLEIGELVIVSLWIRCVEPAAGVGITRFVLEEHGEPYTKAGWYLITAKSEWRHVFLPFRITCDLAAGAYRLEFWIGFGPQVIEIGGLSAATHGRSAMVQEMHSELAYNGRDLAAPWREEAAERIKRFRQADLRIKVVDGGCAPVPGAKLQVRMRRHAFWFGAAVDSNHLLGDKEEDTQYRSVFLELFNSGTPENDLKWILWERDRGRAIDTLRWLRENGFDRIRGHNLIWSYTNTPEDLRTAVPNPAAIRSRMREHIADIVQTCRGLVSEWEVFNEFLYRPDLLNALDRKDWRDLFALARDCDPGAALSLNETGILSHDNWLYQEQYYKLIQLLLKLGAPIDVIGLEGHFDYQLTPPQVLWETLDRFASFGKKLNITEFDVDVPEEKLQAEYTRDFLTAMYAHPAVAGLCLWGFWERSMWKPGGALYRSDWTPKANAEIYRCLVFHDWWTNASVVTGRDGTAIVRGHLGDYEITASAGGLTAAATAHLDAVGSDVMLTLNHSDSPRG